MAETRCACGGRVEPRTDGNGGLVDRCVRCGAKPGRGREPVAIGAKCKVDGCPGVLTSEGACACCAKREQWAAQHAPKRDCGICGGGITGHGKRKFCKPCAKLNIRFGKAA